MDIIQVEGEKNVFTVSEFSCEMHEWLIENIGWNEERYHLLVEEQYWLPPQLQHFWDSRGEVLLFHQDEDAMAFKLRWME